MADRFETKTFNKKIDPRILPLFTSPYVQQQPLQLAGLINHRGQTISYNDCLELFRRKRQKREREREAITQEIVLRALKVDQSQQRSRRHQYEVAARRIVNENYDLLSKQYRKETRGRKIIRDKSAPGYPVKGDNDSERRSRVTSAFSKNSKTNKDLSDSDSEESQIVPLNRLNVLSLERHACEVTMSYRSDGILTNEKPVRDEIVAMQQHSTGQNVVVYRGFLSKGESFSFKSQRRPTSPLSLAFYTKGLIDTVVNDCCEFHYSKRNQPINEHHQFLLERIRKASPCNRCRRRYSQRSLTPVITKPSSDITHGQSGQKIRPRYLTPTPRLSNHSQEHISNSKEFDKNKKPSVSMNTTNKNQTKDKQVTNEQKPKRLPSKSPSKTHIPKEVFTESIDFGLLESTLAHGTKSSSAQLIPIESSEVSTVNGRKLTARSVTTNNKEKQTTTSSKGNKNIQQWVKQTAASPLYSSNESINTLDSRNIFPLHINHQHSQHEHQVRSITSIRHEKSVENFVYILDGNISLSNDDQRKLRGLINYGLIFNNIKDKTCKDFINKIVHEQIIMILSKTSLQKLDSNIHNLPQIRFIYLIDNNNKNQANNHFDKLRGSYKNFTHLYNQLENDMKLFTYDLTTMTSIPLEDTSDSSFAYIQILKDILLETDENKDLKKEMVDFCRQEYVDNEIQLKLINEFDQNFRSDQAVKWYLRQETFIYKILTRAFRIPEPDILFKLRYFIQHLHRQLKLTISKTSVTVYHTQHISNEDFNIILSNHNAFLAFNQFLITNKEKITSRNLPMNKSEFKLVLFEMDIGSTVPKMIGESNPNEILISMGTVFRILNIEHIDQQIPIVKLISNDDVSKSVYELPRNLRDATRGPFPLLRMAKLMKQMEYIPYTEYFCQLLIDDPIALNNETSNLTVGGLFHILCSYYYEQEEYDYAFEQLEKSLKVYLRVLQADDIKLTPTYNNMGSIYHKQGLDDQALQYHKKAYDIQIKSSNPDPESVAAYASNIASVLVKQGRYEEAIPYLQRDLQIRERLNSDKGDLSVAVKYHNLAGAQFRINKYSEALDNYKKCLDIELKIHPETHPTVAVTYYNMATTLEGLGRLEEAIETIEKAQKRLLLTRDDTDEEVQVYAEYEKRLQQKLWVKSLFGTK